MHPDLAPKMARILTEYSAPVKEGAYVTIAGNNKTAGPLIEAMVHAVIRCGGIPNIQTSAMISADYSEYFETFIAEASDQQLDVMDSTMMHWVNRSDNLFFIKAPANTKALSALDPAKISRFRKGAQPFSSRYLERFDAGELMWNVTAFPSPALAQTAEMSLRAYDDFVYRACGLDQPDPVAYWQNFRDEQMRLAAWLKGKKHAEVRGPGITMSFDFQDRPWISCHGDKNFPDGEIFTSPVEDSVNGTVEFNFPTVYSGYEVQGTKLRFENGLAVDVSAAKNEDYLLSTLNVDPGARRLGEFAIGTNMGIQQFTRSILFDEKIGGSIHMALGRSYGESHGKNESAIHWDMVHSMQDGGEIIIDGELFYRSGRFMV
jgi:aminopeptidase